MKLECLDAFKEVGSFTAINLCLSLRWTSLQEVYFYLPSGFLSIYYAIIYTCTLFVHVWFAAYSSQCHKRLFNIVSPDKTWQKSLKNCNSLIRNVQSGPLETQCGKRKREKKMSSLTFRSLKKSHVLSRNVNTCTLVS